MEPQPAIPRKNTASVSICSQRSGAHRALPEGDKSFPRLVIENNDKARNGVRRARMGPRPKSELAGETKRPAVFNLNWTV